MNGKFKKKDTLHVYQEGENQEAQTKDTLQYILYVKTKSAAKTKCSNEPPHKLRSNEGYLPILYTFNPNMKCFD